MVCWCSRRALASADGCRLRQIDLRSSTSWSPIVADESKSKLGKQPGCRKTSPSIRGSLSSCLLCPSATCNSTHSALPQSTAASGSASQPSLRLLADFLQTHDRLNGYCRTPQTTTRINPAPPHSRDSGTRRGVSCTLTMLAASLSPSPNFIPEPKFDSTASYSPRALTPHYDTRTKPNQARSSLTRAQPRHHYPSPSPVQRPLRRSASAVSLDSIPHLHKVRRRMVDASTQYSPPEQPSSPQASTKTPTSKIAGLQIADDEHADSVQSLASPDQPMHDATDTEDTSVTPPLAQPVRSTSHGSFKRPAADDAEDVVGSDNEKKETKEAALGNTPTKKSKSESQPAKIVPAQYEFSDTRDLVTLISSMIMELIRYNDAIPLKDGHLTRFHSRAPPGISVQDYLQRLTTHATLSPPILLSMVYYIDRLCALYPAFTITSLTVHRFLIASGTVASKGLSDSFWTNKTYARVGGVSIKELALLELDFLTRMEWRIVPKPEVLCDYYRSLVIRSETHQFAENNGG